MKLIYLGHSGFLLIGEKGRIVIDPFLTGYPFPTLSPADIQADLILISHGHSDHLGDSLELAKSSGGMIVSNFEIANYCATQGVRTHGMHIGGSRDLQLAKLKLTLRIFR